MMFILSAASCILTALLVSAEPPPSYGSHALVARSQTKLVPESSGVTASHFSPDVFWTHNDSGAPRVSAFRLSEADRREGVAADLGYLELRGLPCTDWEDISRGPEDAIYILDGGDNSPCHRSDKRIIRFKEPKLDWTRGPVQRPWPWEAIRFEYPDPDSPGKPVRRNEDRYDAECLLVDPQTADLYVVTKRSHQDKPVARLYKLPAGGIRWNNRSIHLPEFVADLSKKVPGMVTGGAVSPDGRRVLLRNYLAAYEFTVPAGRPFEYFYEATPRTISLFIEPQGEGICYAWNGDIVTTSETPVGGPRFPVFVTPVATRPASQSAEDTAR